MSMIMYGSELEIVPCFQGYLKSKEDKQSLH